MTRRRSLELFFGLCLIATTPAEAATPTLELVVPNPAIALPKLAPWLPLVAYGLPELEAPRLRTAWRGLGLDPLDPSTWAAAGLAPDRPAHLVVPVRGRPRTGIFVSDPARLRDRLRATGTATVGDGLGFGLGPTGRIEAVGRIRGGRLWVKRYRDRFAFASRDGPEAARRAVAAFTEALAGPGPGAAPQRPRWAPRAAPLAWFRAAGPRGRLEGQLHGGPLALAAYARLTHAGPAPLGRAPPRRLLAAPAEGIAVEVSARLTPALLRQTALGPAARAGLTGEVHAAVTDDGWIVAAVGLSRRATAAKVRTATTALGRAYPGLIARRAAKPRRLVFALPPLGRPRPPPPWAFDAPAGGHAAAPAALRIRPAAALSALGRLSPSLTRPIGLGPGVLPLLQLTYGPAIRSVAAARLQVASRRGQVDASIEIDR